MSGPIEDQQVSRRAVLRLGAVGAVGAAGWVVPTVTVVGASAAHADNPSGPPLPPTQPLADPPSVLSTELTPPPETPSATHGAMGTADGSGTEVLGSRQAAGRLAETGADVLPVALAATGLLGAGAAAVAASRRVPRERRQDGAIPGE